MRKFMAVFLALAVVFAIGCGDDVDNNYNDRGIGDIETSETSVEGCSNPVLAEIKYNPSVIHRLPDMRPLALAEWMYESATAANKECKDYSDILWIYGAAMRALNLGEEPEDVEYWFIKTMSEIVYKCQGGCINA